MKKGTLFLSLALLAAGVQISCDRLPWNDCTKGEGNSYTQLASAATTDKFRFEVPARVTLVQDSALIKTEVEILAQQNVFERLQIAVGSDGFLTIALAECITAYNPMEIVIRSKNIRAIELTGPVDLFSEELFNTDSISIQHSSTGLIDLSLRAQKTKVTHSGTGEILLNGYSEKCYIIHESIGVVKGYNLYTDSSVVSVFNGGNTELTVADTLITNFEGGSGQVFFKGNPVILTNDSARVVDGKF